MPYTRTVDKAGILVTILSGTVTLEELIKLQKGLPHYAENHQVYEMILHSDDVHVSLDRTQSETSASFFRTVIQQPLQGAMAFVSNNPLIFGLCRQLQIRIENEGFEVSVFSTETEARNWLYAKQQNKNSD